MCLCYKTLYKGVLQQQQFPCCNHIMWAVSTWKISAHHPHMSPKLVTSSTMDAVSLHTSYMVCALSICTILIYRITTKFHLLSAMRLHLMSQEVLANNFFIVSPKCPPMKNLVHFVVIHPNDSIEI